MRLGEMLVRDGRLTEAQLASALGFQARDGGRLGTVLFEHGMVDLEALTVYLGLELGIPIATGAMLDRDRRDARARQARGGAAVAAAAGVPAQVRAARGPGPPADRGDRGPARLRDARGTGLGHRLPRAAARRSRAADLLLHRALLRRDAADALRALRRLAARPRGHDRCRPARAAAAWFAAGTG